MFSLPTFFCKFWIILADNYLKKQQERILKKREMLFYADDSENSPLHLSFTSMRLISALTLLHFDSNVDMFGSESDQNRLSFLVSYILSCLWNVCGSLHLKNKRE